MILATNHARADKDFNETTSLMFLSEETQDSDNKVNLAGDWLGAELCGPAANILFSPGCDERRLRSISGVHTGHGS